jgi:uncharacterized protein with HEPN domain
MIPNETITYKGFTITRDRIYGWSLIDRKGAWACSRTTLEKVKNDVDNILKADEEAKTEKTLIP